MLVGSDGILSRSGNAVDKTNDAQIEEEVELALAELQGQFYEEKFVDNPAQTDKETFGDYAADKLAERNFCTKWDNLLEYRGKN